MFTAARRVALTRFWALERADARANAQSRSCRLLALYSCASVARFSKGPVDKEQAMRNLLAFVVVALLSFGLLGSLASTPALSDQLQLAPKATPQVLAPATKRLVPGKQPLNLSQTTQTQLQMVRQGRLDFTCNPIACVCRGDLDCNDMFSTNVCGPNAICIGSFCYCDRSRTLR